MIGLFFVLGLIFGYVSLALQLLGLIEAVIVLGLVLWQARRFPERTGAYLIGLSLVPVIFLGTIVTHMPACDSHNIARGQCYASIAVAVLIGYAIAGLVGAVVLGQTLRRMFAAQPTASS